ncbi:MAG TPA: serine hydrolase [Phnomibacter sp.]|nr:serine hydrolase [Phnomibacter sp.]
MLYQKIAHLMAALLLMNASNAQPTTTPWLQSYLQQQPGKSLAAILKDPAKYRCQILYIQIDRDAANKPILKPHYVYYDPALYFNPASMVKMPLAFLALEKLNRLGLLGVDHTTPMEFLKSQPWQTALSEDNTARNGKPSIGHFIKKAFLVSDNDAYNRLYQWMGQRELHDRLWEKGYKDVVIPRQFLGLTPEQGRYTNAIRFLDVEEHPLYEQPEAYNPTPIPQGEKILLGKAHIDREGKRVEAPFDFTPHNRLSLGDMAHMLLSVLIPEAFEPSQQFQLSADDHQFLRYWLSAYPSETDEPKYDTEKYYDSYVKFFFRDSTKSMPPSVRVFNKVGWAYGFLTDVSYVADFDKGLEYLLAATVYVNSNETLNDGTYDYETLGWPFMYELGQAMYRYEQQRQRPRAPDLESIRLKYGKRDPLDPMPVISEVDN